VAVGDFSRLRLAWFARPPRTVVFFKSGQAEQSRPAGIPNCQGSRVTAWQARVLASGAIGFRVVRIPTRRRNVHEVLVL